MSTTVGRRENSVVRDIAEVGTLADFQREWRLKSGLSYDQLAKDTRESATTLRRAASGAAGGTLVDESVAYSSYAYGDPATPMERSYLGENVKERVVHAGGEVFVQNAEEHTHGFVAPDLGMGAMRSSVILAQVLGREPYAVEKRIAFQEWGIPDRLRHPATEGADA